MNGLHDSAKKLGQLLVERGQVSGEVVLRAIRSQRSTGGRLGTCLLELEAIDEDRLLETLSEQLGAPAAGTEALRAIPEDVVGLVPRKVAERFLAVPFSATDREVDVAVLTTKNVALLDELGFCTSRRVRPHVANEVRIREALAKYYGVECPRRFARLIDRLNRIRYLWKTTAPDLDEAPSDSDPTEISWSTPDDAFGPVARYGFGPVANQARRGETMQGETVQGEARQGEARQGETVQGEAARGEELTLAGVDHLFARAPGPREIGEVLMRFARQHFSRCVCLQVRQGALSGWLSWGEGVDPKLIETYRVDLRVPSVFLNLVRGSELHLGALPPMPTHRALVRCLGGTWPAECLVLPFRVGKRTTAVLYADRGGERLRGLRIEEWKRLSGLVGGALELCILRRKLQAN